MKFPKEALVECILDGRDCDEPALKFIEESKWVDEGKWAFKTYVFEHDGKFYMIENSRSGSYYSDYYYAHHDWNDEVACTEVEKVPVTTYEWRPVRNT